jgi:phospholipid/cholesterol/gamma-HCH transport system permease protein
MPSVQSLAFFNEIGPLVAGLLLAGRVGAGIGAELANMPFPPTPSKCW